MRLSRAPGSSPGALRFCPLALRAVVALLGLLGLSACRPLPPADLTILNGPEPSSLDPLLVTGIEELRAVLPLYEGLTRPDPQTYRPQPGIAERWTISPDGRIYTFQLRTNAAWSDGSPIVAADLVYSWRRVLEPTNACSYASLLFTVRGAEDFHLGRTADFATVGVSELGPRELRVELASPCAYFLELCAFQTLSAVPRRCVEAHGDRWVLAPDAVFSGPYRLDFWRLNDRVRLRRNPHYWGKEDVRSECVDLLSVNLPTTVVNLYLKEQADIVWDKPLVPSELMPELARRPDYHTYPILGTFFLRLNVTRAPFTDVRVRQAFALATDKARLTQRITTSGEEPAAHIVPTVTANYRRGPGQPHDPARARELLAAAGFPGGRGLRPIDLLIDSAGSGSGSVNERAAVELKALWEAELGVNVEIRRMEKKAYLVAQRNLEFDLVRSSWIGDYNDPNTFLDLFMADNGNNRTGWKNARYDDWLRQAAAEPNVERRAEILRDAETFLVRDEVPIIPLWFEVGFNLYRPDRIEGVFPNALDTHPLPPIRRRR